MQNIPILDEANIRGRAWGWFKNHAKSRWALLWAWCVAFADTLASPITAESFLVVLILAHRDRWAAYLTASLTGSIMGAAAGYFLLYFLYRSFGEALLISWGFANAYTTAQELLGAHIFLAMLVASFTPLPDKAFIYAAGILGAPFAPFIAGFALGRGARMSIVTFVVWRFGEPVLEMMERYAVWATVAAVVLGTIYAMVHWHLVPWFW